MYTHANFYLLLDTRLYTYTMGLEANNTGADQPAHPRSLVSVFVIRFLKSVICKLATGEISIL